MQYLTNYRLCRHCPEPIEQSDTGWIDVRFGDVYCPGTNQELTHLPIPDILTPFTVEGE